jgi:glycopeptide antibiotics resistance protein/Cu/Ag efflux protein CusF
MKRLIASLFFALYSALLIKIMVFKDLPTIEIGQLVINLGGANGGHPPNFIPLGTIIPYLFSEQGFLIAGVNLLGNIALLVPLGLVVPMIFKNITWKGSLGIAVLTGLSIEIMQVITNLGIFDIDDVILNALGVMAGYWTYHVLTNWVRTKNYKNIVMAATAITLIAAGGLYILYPKESLTRPTDFTAQNNDLCGDTNGTGQIKSIDENAFTITRNDASLETIEITNATTFKTSKGIATKADLKIGDRVTVIVDESETAAAVLVCGATN